MKKWYKMAGALMAGACMTMQVNAQTHYGVGAGTMGNNHAFFGTQAGQLNDGVDNTFLGHQAGQNNIGGDACTLVGILAGSLAWSNDFATFVGARAGRKVLAIRIHF